MTDLFESAQAKSKVYTVSELTFSVRGLLEDHFGVVRVTGEISGMSVAASGHGYFSLKDEHASFPAVMFRSALSRLGNVPGDGTEVECLGRLTMYEPRGRTQLVVEWMVPQKAGALALRFMELKSRLEKEGLFAPERKRPLPFLPTRIGIVTSPTGAAVRDMLKVLDRRFPSIPVLIAPVRVQGEGAAPEIAAAIGELGSSPQIDVIIAGRGGGSIEDLWAFNEEEVVRAIVASPVPVISAVGHEVDMVLADLAADVRAPTPTAAAEMVVPDREELIQWMQERRRMLTRSLELVLADNRNRLTGQVGKIRDPRLVLNAHRLRLDDASRSMQTVLSAALKQARRRMEQARVGLARGDLRPTVKLWRSRLEEAGKRLRRASDSEFRRRGELLDRLAKQLGGLSPLAVLGRGYSVVSAADGRVVSDAAQLEVGDAVRVRLHKGRFEGTVDRVSKTGKSHGS